MDIENQESAPSVPIPVRLVAAQVACGAAFKSGDLRESKYAPADEIFRVGKEALGAAGLSLVLMGWTIDQERASGVIYGHLLPSFVLVCDDPALPPLPVPAAPWPLILAKGTPPSRATAIALSQVRSYLLQGLLNMERAEEPRNEESYRAPGELHQQSREQAPAPTPPVASTAPQQGPQRGRRVSTRERFSPQPDSQPQRRRRVAAAQSVEAEADEHGQALKLAQRFGRSLNLTAVQIMEKAGVRGDDGPAASVTKLREFYAEQMKLRGEQSRERQDA